MALKILCAGCSKDEREGAEAVVRRVLGDAAARTPWSVSLVKMGAQWQVTVDAPADQIRARTAVAPASGLAAALTSLAARPAPDPPPVPAAVAAAPVAAPAKPSAPATAPAPARPFVESSGTPTPMAGLPAIVLPKAGDVPGATACGKCAKRFRVVFESAPGEPLEEAPVACPYCWSLNRVKVGSEAAATSDYRADKID